MGHNANQNLTRTLKLLFLYLSLASLVDLISADPPYHSPCINTTTFSDTIDPIHNNLDTLLSSLTTGTSFPKQYNTSTGNDPDTRVYVQYMCQNYETNTSCKACVDSASEVIKQACPGDKESIAWEDNCQLSYSNRNFLGQLDVSENQAYWNSKNVSGNFGEEFGVAVNATLSGLAKQAAYNGSTDRYATGTSNVTGPGTVYALVQCTRDLSPGDCHTCLMVALANVSSRYLSRGARVYSRSCYLRYELYNFYQGATDSEAAPAERIGGAWKSRKWRIVVISATVALLSVALFIVGSFLCCLANRKKIQKCNEVENNRNSNLEVRFPGSRSQSGTKFQQFDIQGKDGPRESAFISFATILKATDNFSGANLLGRGGFGPVYKGILSDGQEVAVKRLSSCSEQGNEEFTNEVLLIMKLQHKNLVKLLGFCIDGEEKLLVYEFMPNGSLDVILFDPKREAELDWSRRINIINGIAKGILYLHEDSRLRIVHRDLKASNVLLDNNMNPKISDFGMARIFGGNESDSSSTARIVGTYGYMAPEYAMEGIYSTKSDVFSFGVLLIEIISGRRNNGFHRTKLAPSLIAYAWKLWDEGKEQELMDPSLSEACSSDDFSWYMRIGLLCVQEDANDRPTMSSVVLMLKSDKDMAAAPQPAQRSAFSPKQFLDEYEENKEESK